MPIMKMAGMKLVPLTICLDEEDNLFFSFKLQALQNVFLNQLSLVETLYDYLSYRLSPPKY